MSIDIEKGIPLPPNINYGAKRKYPFSSMEIGDSFFAANCSAKNVQTAAYCWARDKSPGKKFITRTQTEPAGARCWRII